MNHAVTTSATGVQQAEACPPPRLDRSQGPARLVVDGDPFLVRGVELHNSSPSAAGSLAAGLRSAVAANANTVLASVTWEEIEPVEGRFVLDSVRSVLEEARAAGLRVILLWFGAWKNGSSSYAPTWVKRDWDRFPRCVLEDGRVTETLTPFAPGDLDLAAFRRVMEYIEEIDAEHRTVLMVQIENEVGLLGASRDRSREAQKAFAQPVPENLRHVLSSQDATTVPAGLCWSDLPGDPSARDEAFMAWAFASHIEKLARAGRSVSPVPFFTNAWLDSEIDLDIPGFAVAGGQVPGTYPSGGPLPRVAGVWRMTAPTVDLFAPDFYFGQPDTVFGDFLTMSGGLFIPEMRRDAVGAGHALLAIGEYHALGVSPFGTDSADLPELAELSDVYDLIRQTESMLTLADGTPAVTRGFHLDDATPRVALTMGSIVLTVTRWAPIGIDAAGTYGYGLIVAQEEDVFLAVGRGFRIGFTTTDPAWQIGLEAVTEGRGGPDGWKAERRLNGDETAGGTAWMHPQSGQTSASPFPIPAHGDHSGISRCRIYRFPSREAPALD
ncbi:DUF5597 domain-containing protein [Streptomyces sp. P17]|uniref:DUF5597 domain-containing protein n=1 Tax=Streptomyces sp. P17 TaxID=3074716 RepID=UPI0028F3E7B5|nr:DUF5597 domain-containing protein [Streptomyces sp. P17]MDT9700273.1 DUF5597 domain-containing protein [Streptomyces sp. P17]